MTELALPLLLLVLLAAAALQTLALRRAAGDLGLLRAALAALERDLERVERGVRDEVARVRDELSGAARADRQEQAAQLAAFRESVAGGLRAAAEGQEHRLDGLRSAVEHGLRVLRDENARQLDQIRQTVDEKLQGTLEKRLGESFRHVGERLEQVYRGLGEMQALAAGVGDLKRVLSNVRTRGTWGEVQLGAMLEQVLTPEQYAANVATRGGSERVEYAVRLPGRGGEEPVWLPIDAKFPLEDYQRLVDAEERADPEAAEQASRQLELRVRACAKEICDKYLAPPRTTDFGILFLPVEGLFAAVVRRTGLTELIQRECRVVVAGPTTLWSLLSSLQMGFRTLAVAKRSSEVWTLLGAVKNEWGRYGEVLARVQRKLTEASDTLDKAQTRSRAIGRRLRRVEELPAAEADALLGLGAAEDDEPEPAA